MIYGYARVSTCQQDTEIQLKELRRFGVDLIYEEKISGVSRERPELKKLLARLKQGDVLVVYKLDRLGRSVRQIMDIFDLLTERGCGFKSLTEPFDTTSALGEFFLHIMAAFAQFERSLIRERSIAGQLQAMKKGVIFGPKSSITPELTETFRDLRGQGLTYKEIGRIYGLSADTVSRHARGVGFAKRGTFPLLSKRLLGDKSE